MNSKCEFCNDESEFLLVTHCDFQVCEKHLILEPKSADSKMVKCVMCQEDFDLEEVKKTTKNTLRLLDRDFEERYNELMKRLNVYSLYKQDLNSIKTQNFQNIKRLIESRKKEIEDSFKETLDREYTSIMRNLDTVKEVYMQEIKKSLMDIDIESTERIFSNVRDEIDSKLTAKEKISFLSESIHKISSKFTELETAKISIDKYKNIDLKKSEQEFNAENLFGILTYKSGTLKKIDLADIKPKMTLESIFGFVDYSKTVLPDFENDIDFNSKPTLTLKGHFAKINKIQQLPDGNLISASDDCTIKIWDKTNGLCKKSLAGQLNSIKNFILLSPTELASVSSCDLLDKIKIAKFKSTTSLKSSEVSSIFIWDLNTGKNKKIIQGPNATIHTIDSYDEDTIMIGDSNGYIRFINISSGNCLDTFEAHEGSVYSIKFLKKDQIISSSSDYSIKVWNKVGDQWSLSKEYNEHQGIVWCLTLLNKNQFLSGSGDGSIKLWNTNLESKQSERTFADPDKVMNQQNTIRTIKIIEDDKFLSISDNGDLILWSLKQDHPINKKKVNKEVDCMEFSSTSDVIVAFKGAKNNFEIGIYSPKKN